MLVGLLLAGLALLTGAAFWTALAVYSLGGALTVLALSLFVYFGGAAKLFPTSRAGQRHRRENART